MTEQTIAGRQPRMRSKRVSEIVNKTIIYVILAFFTLLVLIPFYIILITSFKVDSDASTIPFQWWPREFSVSGYLSILTNDITLGGGSLILKGFVNTLIIVVPSTLLGLLSSAICAYALAKIQFPGNKLIFTLLLATMMLPGVIMLVPSYVLYDNLNLVDTRVPLMLPGMFGTAACVFFLRQFFAGIPTELVEVGKVDGMNHLKIFFVVMVPLSVPALLSQGILGFIAGYNDYFGPLLYLLSPEKYTLQIALQNVMGTYTTSWPTVMAGCVVALIPTLLIYFFAQNYFIKGIAMSGLKA